jgi:hypothetical protein
MFIITATSSTIKSLSFHTHLGGLHCLHRLETLASLELFLKVNLLELLSFFGLRAIVDFL